MQLTNFKASVCFIWFAYWVLALIFSLSIKIHQVYQNANHDDNPAADTLLLLTRSCVVKYIWTLFHWLSNPRLRTGSVLRSNLQLLIA